MVKQWPSLSPHRDVRCGMSLNHAPSPSVLCSLPFVSLCSGRRLLGQGCRKVTCGWEREGRWDLGMGKKWFKTTSSDRSLWHSEHSKSRKELRPSSPLDFKSGSISLSHREFFLKKILVPTVHPWPKSEWLKVTLRWVFLLKPPRWFFEVIWGLFSSSSVSLQRSSVIFSYMTLPGGWLEMQNLRPTPGLPS